jgi:hypothetical protein
MSATLSNIADLQRFLNAEIYINEFRPVSYFLFSILRFLPVIQYIYSPRPRSVPKPNEAKIAVRQKRLKPINECNVKIPGGAEGIY